MREQIKPTSRIIRNISANWQMLCVRVVLSAAVLALGFMGVNLLQNTTFAAESSRTISYAGQDVTKLTATLKVGDTVYSSVESNGDTITVPYYGKWQVEITDGDNNTTTEEVPIAASKYNIANLTSSVPSLLYTLKFLGGEIEKTDQNGQEIPSIITTSRPNQFDWDHLPEGMYANPFVDNSRIQINNLSPVYNGIFQYVSMLSEISPDATFNIWLNDCHFLQGLTPVLGTLADADDQGRVNYRFITDGGGVSYSMISESYPDSDYQDDHAAHTEMWNTIKAQLKNSETLSSDLKNQSYKAVYAAVDSERDAKWFIIRKSADTITPADENLQTKILNDDRVVSSYMNNLLTKVEEAGQANTLKTLYKFEDQIITDILSRNKIPMLIIGSSRGLEATDPVKDYIPVIQELYGENYELVYKPHPGNVASTYDVAGIPVLDPGIAAELFSFFYPSVVMSGYASTTFLSLNEEQKGALIGVNKYDAYNSEDRMYAVVKQYADGFDYFLSRNNGEIIIEEQDVIPQDEENTEETISTFSTALSTESAADTNDEVTTENSTPTPAETSVPTIINPQTQDRKIFGFVIMAGSALLFAFSIVLVKRRA